MDDIIRHESLQWRLIGSIASQLGLVLVTVPCLMIVCKSVSWILYLGTFGPGLLTVPFWSLVTSIQLATVVALVGHAFALFAVEPMMPVDIYLQYLPSVVSVVVMKVAGRVSSAKGAIKQLVLLGSSLVSGVVLQAALMALLGGTMGIGDLIVMSTMCTFMYYVHVVFWSRDVLMFPSMQKYRLYRFQEQIVSIVLRALPVGMEALLGYLGVLSLLGLPMPPILRIPGIFTVGYVSILLWSCASWIVEIIFSERLRPRDYNASDVMKAMQDCLDGKCGDFMYSMAMHDLSYVASDSGKLAWRRQTIFADDSGSTWNRMASRCMDVIVDAISDAERIGQRREEEKKKKRDGDVGAPVAKWNTLPSNIGKPSNINTNDSLQFSLQIIVNHQSLVFSIRFLSDMAHQSALEDRYGILQLGEPSLGDILFALINLSIQLKHARCPHGKSLCHTVRWRASGDDLYPFRKADSVADVLSTEIDIAVKNLVNRFGMPLMDAVDASSLAKASTKQAAHVRVKLHGYCQTI